MRQPGSGFWSTQSVLTPSSHTGHRSQHLALACAQLTNPQLACWGDRKLHVASGGRRFTRPFLLVDVALPIIGANFLWHFGLLVDLGEMGLLAHKGGWSQQLVAPSGSGMFATIGVIADQPPQPPSVKKKKHEEATHTARASTLTSNSLPTVEALSSPSLPTVEAPGSSPSLQHVLDEFPSMINTSKVLPIAQAHTPRGALPSNGGPPSHCQV